jgi:TRAP-type mannitol/chloroaromatic compound transport system permease large subunit
VVIPPSLVLILLGDAMLGAHTIAVTTTGRSDRVINTQDIFHGTLVPAGLFLLLCLVAAWIAGHRLPAADRAPEDKPTHTEVLLATTTVTFLLLLLGAVALGFFYAVEAAALGAFVLFTGGLLSGRLRGGVLRDVLTQAMTMTGALFALLIAATTLTLMLRILGTDRLVAAWVAALPGDDLAVVAIVLLAIGLCAFVLDAFEIIFVIVPIVVPPLLIRVADARWVAVLLLLTLQASFLLPPVGYALMMVRGTLRYAGSLTALARALFPFLIAQWLVLAAVLLLPQLAHIGEKETKRETPNLSTEEINRRMQDMLTPLPDLDPPK